MKMIQTILFPTDFSHAANAIVPYVTEIVQRFGKPVVVLHAFDAIRNYVLTSAYEVSGGESLAVPYTEAFQELRHEREQRLEQFVQDHFANVPHIAKIQDGDAASVIEFVAHNENAGLIVMSTRGHGKFRRLLLGSITAKVLHDLSCPVLTSVHEPDSALAPARGFRSIVCAVDLNQETDAILDGAAFFARVYGAKLCIVHVGPAISAERNEEVAAQSLKRALQGTLNVEGRTFPVEAKVCVLDAGIPEGIRDTAVKEKADLVVVGRGHDQGNISRLWSHLYTIIRESPCPVLSI